MPSLIVDFSTSTPHGLGGVATVESSVWLGQFICAWARAEHCDVQIDDGKLELWCRYTPSAELEQFFGMTHHCVTGVLGWAVPLRLDQRKRPFAASWPYLLGADRS